MAKGRIKNYDSAIGNGEKIRSLVAATGLNQDDCADRKGIAFGTLKKLMAGKMPVELELCVQCADAFGVQPEEIISTLVLRGKHGQQEHIPIAEATESLADAISKINKRLDADLVRILRPAIKAPAMDNDNEFSPMERFIIDTIVGGIKLSFLGKLGDPIVFEYLQSRIHKIVERIVAKTYMAIEEATQGSIVLTMTMGERDAISLARAFSQGRLDDLDLFRIDFTQLTPKLEAALLEVTRGPGDTIIVLRRDAGQLLATLSRKSNEALVSAKVNTPTKSIADPLKPSKKSPISTRKWRWSKYRGLIPSDQYDHKGRGNFGLIERLCVLGIISVLATILVPAVQHAREAARRAQCQNNLKQLALAVQNYHMSSNVIPAMCTFSYDPETGAVSGQAAISRGWSSAWPLAILPQLEQGDLYSRYNFSAPAVAVAGGGYSGFENTTVLYTQLPTFLCPSENASIRPAREATSNYAGNYGGPGQIAYYTGLIIPLADPNGHSSPLGRLGPVSIEGIHDGLSNTALFGEHLHGIGDGSPNGPNVALGGKDGRRGIFTVIARGTGPKTGVAGATAFDGARQALPQGTASAYSNRLGNTMYATHPWQVGMVNYNHVGPPNSVNCLNPNDPAWLTYVGPLGSASVSSNHPGGANVGMADGSVRFVRDSITPKVWWGLGSRNGREIIPPGEF